MKKILIITSLIFGGAYLYGRHKLDQYEKAIKELKLGFEQILDVNIQNGYFTGFLVLSITNPTSISLGVNTRGIVELKKLFFYTPKGRLIGTASPEIDKFYIPANDKYIPENPIPFQIPFTIDDILNAGLDFLQDSKNIKVVAEIEILGKTHRIS